METETTSPGHDIVCPECKGKTYKPPSVTGVGVYGDTVLTGNEEELLFFCFCFGCGGRGDYLSWARRRMSGM